MLIDFDDSKVIEKCVSLLKEGEVVIAPSDTIYGFLAAVPKGKERLIEIKGRDEGKPFLQLVSSIEMVERYIKKTVPDDIKSIWPAPLTVIFDNLHDNTTAFRYPNHSFLLDLIEAVGSPLYSTSVNRSGFDPMHNIKDIYSEFNNDVKLIVDNGVLPISEPSTLIDSTVNPYKIIRQGSVHL